MPISRRYATISARLTAPPDTNGCHSLPRRPGTVPQPLVGARARGVTEGVDGGGEALETAVRDGKPTPGGKPTPDARRPPTCARADSSPDESLDLWQVLQTIWSWEATWVTEHIEPLPPMYHQACGEEFSPVMHCRACGQTAGLRDVLNWATSGSARPKDRPRCSPTPPAALSSNRCCTARSAAWSCTARRSRPTASRPWPRRTQRGNGRTALAHILGFAG
jgi:hypothetical protein